jgi:Protein of unknown function (DUF3307)
VRWVAVLDVFIVSHLVGDFLVQADWQATHKYGGLDGDPIRRQALTAHVSTYTLAFVPAPAWIGCETEPWRALLAAVVIAVPHLIQDDGRAVPYGLLRHYSIFEPMPMATVERLSHDLTRSTSRATST